MLVVLFVVDVAMFVFQHIMVMFVLMTAEALRRAMLALADDANPAFAPPEVWAAFVVVGDANASLGRARAMH